MEIAAKNRWHRDSGFRIQAGKSNPPLSPFYKGGGKGDFFGLLTYGELPAMRLPRRYRSSQ
jgi:hypothetical protein